AEVLERLFSVALGVPRPSNDSEGQPIGDTRIWQRVVTSPDGLHRPKTQPGSRFFVATLARHRLALAFSPDDRLVESAVAVADRTYPSLADVLPEERTVLAVLVPSLLGTLAEAEAFASLPPGQEPVFRTAATAHLVPRLAALKRYPSYALVLPADASPHAGRWLAVEWRPLGRP